MSLRRVALGVLLVGLVLSFAGCGGKVVNKSNYDKIKMGMTVSQVEAILGKGQQKVETTGGLPPAPGMPGMPTMTTSASIMVWAEGKSTITVTFMDGKVAVKAQSGL
ncbi:MAG TPA: outer membrane protein assembly factor BamE [Phycisphaerae bacterium]|nr:outer membrane protein assembly factor BamE [Phycisphaerae bacterium]